MISFQIGWLGSETAVSQSVGKIELHLGCIVVTTGGERKLSCKFDMLSFDVLLVFNQGSLMQTLIILHHVHHFNEISSHCVFWLLR